MSSIILAILAALTSIALMPFFKNLPQAVLAAIVINAVLGFVNVSALKRLRDLRRDSFVLALLALIGVLILGILPGLLITVAISLLLLLSKFGRPSTSEVIVLPESGAVVAAENHPEIEAPPGLFVLRPDSPIIFANASWIRDDIIQQIEALPAKPRVVVLDLEMSSDLDVTGLEMLSSLQRDLDLDGTQLWLSNVHRAAAGVLERGGLTVRIGSGHIYGSAHAAVAAFDSRETTDRHPDEPMGGTDESGSNR